MKKIIYSVILVSFLFAVSNVFITSLFADSHIVQQNYTRIALMLLVFIVVFTKITLSQPAVVKALGLERSLTESPIVNLGKKDRVKSSVVAILGFLGLFIWTGYFGMVGGFGLAENPSLHNYLSFFFIWSVPVFGMVWASVKSRKSKS